PAPSPTPFPYTTLFRSLAYLRLTARDPARVALVAAYTRAQGLFRAADMPEPEFSDHLELDLGSVEPSLAGPRRPQDRVPLRGAKDRKSTRLNSSHISIS